MPFLNLVDVISPKIFFVEGKEFKPEEVKVKDLVIIYLFDSSRFQLKLINFLKHNFWQKRNTSRENNTNISLCSHYSIIFLTHQDNKNIFAQYINMNRTSLILICFKEFSLWERIWWVAFIFLLNVVKNFPDNWQLYINFHILQLNFDGFGIICHMYCKI